VNLVEWNFVVQIVLGADGARDIPEVLNPT
jgi:hypothetical protein